MAFKQRLPDPKWQGFEAGCLEKFLAFVIDERLKRSDSVADELSHQIKATERELGEWTGYVESDKSSVVSAKEELDDFLRVKAQAQNVDPGMIEQQLLDIATLPYVTAITVNGVGALVVRIVLRDEWPYPIDGGEVEVDFSFIHRDDVFVNVVRFPFGENGLWMGGRRRQKTATLSIEDAKSLSQAVAEVREYLTQVNRGRRYLITFRKLRTEPLEYSKELVLPALKVAIIGSSDAQRRQEARLRANLVQAEASLKEVRDKIRALNIRLRTLRAEHVKIAAEEEGNIVVNIDDVANELRNIIALPGVMGLKFKGGIPVFHIRASYLRKGHRYDMGDYELRLELYHGRYEGVVHLHATRRGSDYYYHSENGSDTSWFCFGSRASEMNTLFEHGHYAAFMGLAVNSMNGVNKGERRREDLKESFHEIPVDLVWPKALTAPSQAVSPELVSQ